MVIADTFNENVFDAFPVLQTKRLLLRAILLKDAEAVFAMRKSGRVGAFIPRPQMQSVESAKELITRVENGFLAKEVIGWAGEIKATGVTIGTCGFNSIDKINLRAEIGGEMDVNYWGQFFAVEAVKRIIAFGFEDMHLHSIEAKVAPQNKSAIAVMAQLGFVKEAHFRDMVWFNGAFSDMAVYTLFKSNWQSNL